MRVIPATPFAARTLNFSVVLNPGLCSIKITSGFRDNHPNHVHTPDSLFDWHPKPARAIADIRPLIIRSRIQNANAESLTRIFVDIASSQETARDTKSDSVRTRWSPIGGTSPGRCCPSHRLHRMSFHQARHIDNPSASAPPIGLM